MTDMIAAYLTEMLKNHELRGFKSASLSVRARRKAGKVVFRVGAAKECEDLEVAMFEFLDPRHQQKDIWEESA